MEPGVFSVVNVAFPKERLASRGPLKSVIITSHSTFHSTFPSVADLAWSLLTTVPPNAALSGVSKKEFCAVAHWTCSALTQFGSNQGNRGTKRTNCYPVQLRVPFI